MAGRAADGLQGNEVLTLPYGNVDVPAAAPARPRAARRRPGPAQQGARRPRHRDARRLCSPERLPRRRVHRGQRPRTRMLVTDDARARAARRGRVDGPATSSSPRLGRAAGQPGPGARSPPSACGSGSSPRPPCALLKHRREPLVVGAPDRVGPRRRRRLLRAASTSRGSTSRPSTTPRRRPRRQLAARRHRLPPPRAASRARRRRPSTPSTRLIRSGETLQKVLADNNEIAGIHRAGAERAVLLRPRRPGQPAGARSRSRELGPPSSAVHVVSASPRRSRSPATRAPSRPP